eukprot:5328950-Alexandrium_andersonii.AAC.1
MQGRRGISQAARAEERDGHCLREVDLEVGERRVGLEDLHDAREVLVVPEDDCRIVSEGQDDPIIPQLL